LENGTKTILLKNKDLNFGYRKSLITNSNLIVLNAEFELSVCEKEKIILEQNLAIEKKKSTQPYSDYSAGSVFKRHKDLAVSKMIDDLGLKGYKIGGAEISTVHAGFIVNKGQASCKDILKLIEYIREKIFEAHGFKPELEIEIIGDTNDFTRRLSHTHDI
jgi:UDP-N-acetylmuramate dehydrogenase